MTSEDSFHDRVEEELASLRPPPIGEIAGEALAHGRRIRRRERVFGVVGGTAAVAGVAAGVVALSGGFASGGAGSAIAPGGVGPGPTTQRAPVTTPTTPTAPTTPPSSPASAPTTTPPSTPPSSSSSGPNTVIGTIPASWKPPAPGSTLTDPTNTDGPSVADLLIDDLGLIGPGSGSSFSGGSMAGMNANATMTWTTQHGSIRISASVSNGSADGKTPESVCHPGYETDYCAAGTLSDGSVVMVVHGTGEPASGRPTHNELVMITRPDHAAINIVEWSNGPLTDDQLYKIVSDPRWGLRMDGSFVAHADQVVRPFSG